MLETVNLWLDQYQAPGRSALPRNQTNGTVGSALSAQASGLALDRDSGQYLLRPQSSVHYPHYQWAIRGLSKVIDPNLAANLQSEFPCRVLLIYQ